MNADLLYLQHIRERITRIETYLTNITEDQFSDSTMLQDSVIRNFEVIGEATKRLSAALRESKPDIPWKRIAGFRDVLIHGYDDIDLEEVWSVIQDALPTLRDTVDELLKNIADEPDDDSSADSGN